MGTKGEDKEAKEVLGKLRKYLAERQPNEVSDMTDEYGDLKEEHRPGNFKKYGEIIPDEKDANFPKSPEDKEGDQSLLISLGLYSEEPIVLVLISKNK